ncbi:MAG: extracellular solute-binding protein [Candidatus Gracilibacteria bacterium]
MSKKALIVIGSFFGILFLFLVLPFIFGGKPASTTTGSTRSNPGGEIVFWNLFDEQDLYAGLFQLFESRNPKVKVVYKKYTNIHDYESDFINELAEGKGPDIIAIQPSWLLKHKGKLVPMPEKSFYYGNADKFKDTFLGPAADDLIIKEKDTATKQDKSFVYAVPVSMDSLGVIYNRDLLIKYAAKNIPASTWQGFEEDAKKIVRKSADGTQLLRGGVALGDMESLSRSMDIVELMMLQNGVRFYDQTMREVSMLSSVYASGRSLNPAEDALAFFTSFGKNRNVNFSWSPQLTAEKPADRDMGAFVQSKVGMIFGYSYYINDLTNLANQYKTSSAKDIISADYIRGAEIPQITDTTSGAETSKAALANYFPLSVTKSSKNPQYSWELINFLAQPEQQQFLFRKGKKLTSRFDLVDEQMKDPVYGAFVKQNIYAKSVLIPDVDKLYTVFKEQFVDLNAGRKDEKQVLVEIQKELQCQLDKLNAESGTVLPCEQKNTGLIQR